MKVVVDTNVLISGFLSPRGPPAEIARMILNGDLRICYDLRILSEYKEVLGRPRFGISPVGSANLLEQILVTGESANALPLPPSLLDPGDEAFLEVAISCNADCLITGNLKHFPVSCRRGVRVISPREFLAFYEGRETGGSGRVKNPAAEYKLRKLRKRKKD